MLARIDAYGALLKTEHPGMRVERGDVIRELVHVGLGVVEARTAETSIDTGGGPIESPVTLGADQPADHAPCGADPTDRKAAPPQDHHRTTGRTGRKRLAAAKG